MNTLTKNRILEKGDEYKKNGEWKPIPDNDLGMQIMFTKYSEVRRPSEEPSKTISPNASNTKAAQGTAVPKATAEAEAKPVPASGVSPAGGESRALEHAKKLITYAEIIADPALDAMERESAELAKKLAKRLPTVVSKKAHEIEYKPIAIKPSGVIEIPFPAKATPCQWIGRNGTFYAKGVQLQVIEHLMEEDNLIQIRPKGARGLAKNALIEFPASIIPQVVDWLIRMQPRPAPSMEKPK